MVKKKIKFTLLSKVNKDSSKSNKKSRKKMKTYTRKKATLRPRLRVNPKHKTKKTYRPFKLTHDPNQGIIQPSTYQSTTNFSNLNLEDDTLFNSEPEFDEIDLTLNNSWKLPEVTQSGNLPIEYSESSPKALVENDSHKHNETSESSLNQSSRLTEQHEQFNLVPSSDPEFTQEDSEDSKVHQFPEYAVANSNSLGKNKKIISKTLSKIYKLKMKEYFVTNFPASKTFSFDAEDKSVLKKNITKIRKIVVLAPQDDPLNVIIPMRVPPKIYEKSRPIRKKNLRNKMIQELFTDLTDISIRIHHLRMDFEGFSIKVVQKILINLYKKLYLTVLQIAVLMSSRISLFLEDKSEECSDRIFKVRQAFSIQNFIFIHACVAEQSRL